MSSRVPECFEQVTAVVKANLFFEGKVASHTLLFPDGTKKTLGLIYPGVYTFNTGAPERMEITSGSSKAKVAGASDWTGYSAGAAFDVPGNSSFEISVEEGVLEYVCSFR